MLKEFDFIESVVPERVFLAAEILMDSSEITEKKSQVRNLQLFELKDDKTYEIEVLTTPKYIKSVSCECEEYHSKQICSHIVACLLKIRSDRETKIAEIEKAVGRKTAPQSLTIESIFNHVDIRHVKAFIKHYASRNSKFDSEFKVNFARRVPIENMEEKYSSLLDKILNPITKAGKRITIPGLTFFLKQCQELFEQYKDSYSLENYLEASIILRLLLNKVSYVKARFSGQRDKLDQFYIQLHEQIPRLLKTDLAPELFNKVTKDLLEVLSLSYYSYPSLSCNIPTYLHRVNLDDLNEQIITTLFRSLEKYSIDETVSNGLSYILLIGGENPELFDLVANTQNIQTIPTLFAKLFQLEQYDLANSFLKHCETNIRFRGFNFNAIKLVLANKLGRTSEIISLTTDLFLKTKDPQKLEKIMSFPTELIEDKLVLIRRELEKNVAYAKMVCKIMIFQGEYDLLLSYVEDIQQFELLRPYIDEIHAFEPRLVELHVRKYMERCRTDISYTYTNHNEMMVNMDRITDAAFSGKNLKLLREFREELLDALP